MQAGILNPDNFGDVLRTVATKRRQGTLELTIADAKESIVFNAGKIVEVISASTPPVLELTERLKQAGALVDPAALALVRGYGELFRAVTFHEELSGNRLRQIVRHRILARLFAFSATSGAYFNFRSELAEYDREYAAAISVGQLLLDIAACLETEKRFAAVFEKKCIISSVAAGDEPLSEEEGTMHSVCREPGSLEDVMQRSLLCDFYAREALLALYERGLVEISEAAKDIIEPLSKALPSEIVVEEIATSGEVENVSAVVAGMSVGGGMVLGVGKRSEVSLESYVLWGFALLTLVIVPFFLWRDLFRFF